jgi:transcriptional regulator with XRE-family HTH domain
MTVMIYRFNFGKALRVIQAKEGVSSVELARRLGLTKQQISHWRYREDAKLSLVAKICNCLDVELSEFMETAVEKIS